MRLTVEALLHGPALRRPQMEALRKTLAKFGIVELVRTGRISLKRGERMFDTGSWNPRWVGGPLGSGRLGGARGWEAPAAGRCQGRPPPGAPSLGRPPVPQGGRDAHMLGKAARPSSACLSPGQLGRAWRSVADRAPGVRAPGLALSLRLHGPLVPCAGLPRGRMWRWSSRPSSRGRATCMTRPTCWMRVRPRAAKWQDGRARLGRACLLASAASVRTSCRA